MSSNRPRSQRRAPVSVDDHLRALDHPKKDAIERLRAIVLRADPRVREEVKWNAPSFAIHEHFATLKLQPRDTLQVVLHTGARAKPDAGPVTVDDPTGLLRWASADRCVVTFDDLRDVERKEEALLAVLEQWIARTAPPGSEP